MHTFVVRPLLLALCLLAAGASSGAEGAKKAEGRPETGAALQEKTSRTKASIRLGAGAVDYIAEAGTIVVRGEEGTPKGSFFYVAYLREGSPDVAKRPLSFCFNGGPGAASAWLHLGALGPRRVLLHPEGKALAPPYRLADNEHTALDLTDLVFVDPIDTGYSRSAPGEDRKQFHGLEEDLHWVGEFIRLYTSRSGRWSSPKFLIGESYGAVRAAGLAEHLQERLGLYLNGVVLVSPVLDFATISFDPGNDLPYALVLPTYTAAAWYHGRLASEYQADRAWALRESEEFATREYASALLQGSALPEPERKKVVRRLSELTGIRPEVFGRADLRLSLRRFLKELLADNRRVLGIYDGRVTGFDPDPDRNRSGYDPSYEAIQGAVQAAITSYLATELGYTSDLHYEILAPNRVQPWDLGSNNRYANVTDRLAEALAKRPFLKVLFALGTYDLATPYFAALHSARHLGIDPSLEKNVTVAYYDAGHMLYTDEPSLAKFKKDLTAFFRSALAEAR